ncbi:alpha/beta hydrolase fold family protein [Collimonas arenae]|uniref:Alpha/beta hydrolase fold family protein n=1 Tax=Collimonas arenae TaxID=279058 RepID=A0A127PWV6_9BURK|nr:alpha/beta fold hydrolase [Collimonas arenae]AMP01852.1 alpha/beta hydrolase fold family protein [Collimonas arenae]AMP11751.1 alpha/beta hydrolase fold family protein [Collimonas arenae]
MTFNADLHRSTLKLPNRLARNGVYDSALEMSVLDAGPEYGRGPRNQQPTMVFIHGFGGRAAYWEYQLEQFQIDYRVIALDLRGHGYTDAPTEAEGAHYDVPELVADIVAALDQLDLPPQFILVCHSFGGALSSYFLKHFPERVSALVVIASAARFRLRLAGRMLLRMPPRIFDLARRIMPYLGINAARIYPPSHVVYLQNKNALLPWDGREYLRAINVPTLVILGHRDILFDEEAYKEVARLIPGAEEVVVPVSAHQVMVERPDAVNRAIERFLQMQSDPLQLAERRAQQKAERRAARKQLEAERPWLKFYDSRTPYRIKLPTVPLPRLLEGTARRFGKTTALSYGGGKINWRELDRQANRFAHGLINMRIKPGERVLLALPNMPSLVIAYFGVLKAGAVAVLSDAATSPEVLLTRIVDAAAVVLITTTNRYDELRDELQTDPRAAGLRRVIFASMIDHLGWREKLKFALLHHVQEGHWLPWFRQDSQHRRQERRYLKFKQVLGRGNNYVPEVAQDVADIAVVVYTYGTTRTPLPVALSHRNLAANALQLRHWLPESRPGDERFLAQQPLTSAYGLTGLLHLGVYLGATLILLPGAELEPLLKTVRKMRPTYFPTTPRMVRELAHTAGVRRYGLASIRVCAVSGSPLAQEIREEFEKLTRGRLVEAYGLTEASPAVLAMPLSARPHPGVVGVPLPDTEVKVVDLDNDADLPPDTLGELWVRGPQLFSGYDHAHAGLPTHSVTALNLIAKKISKERLHDGWFATGDVASIDEDGFVSIIDRKSNMLIRGGQRVFPRQIEEILFEHPAVAVVHVKWSPDDEGVNHLRAEVLLHHNMKVSVEELLKYASKRLHAEALPDSIAIEQKNTTVLF